METEVELKLLTRKEVIAIVRFGKSSIEKWVKQGTFPAKVKIGRSTFWLASEIYAWLRDRIAADRQARETQQTGKLPHRTNSELQRSSASLALERKAAQK